MPDQLSWQVWLAVGGGSAVGGLLRFGIGRWLDGRTTAGIPLATWLVNVVGSAVLCWLTVRHQRIPLDPRLQFGLTSGLLGGFTTYSAFNGELVRKLQEGLWFEAGLYLAATVGSALSHHFGRGVVWKARAYAGGQA